MSDLNTNSIKNAINAASTSGAGAPSNAMILLGTWASGTRYVPDDVVYYSVPAETGTQAGSYYVCISDTILALTTPPAAAATSTTYWKPLDSATFLGAYAAGSTYNKDASVSYQGSVYQSLTDGQSGNTPLTSLTNWTSFGYKAMNVPFSTICTNTNFTANTPLSVKTISLSNVGTYNFARGYGLIYFSAGAAASAPQIRVYFSETLNGAFPATFDNSIQSVFANTGLTGGNVVGWVDLSRVMYRSTTGFTTLYLNISFTQNVTGTTCNPVGAVTGSFSTSSSVSVAAYSASTTTASGAAGVILMKEPFVPA